jgi:rhamnosyltransferase
MVMSTAAIVVLYHPQELLLKRVLQGIATQAQQIYLIDNTPSGQESAWLSKAWLDALLEGDREKPVKVVYQSLGENAGIAKAQNVGIDLALQEGYEDLIFFDQDSAPTANLVSDLLSAREGLMAKGVAVGMIGPAVFDEKSNTYSPIIRTGRCWIYAIKFNPHWTHPVSVDYIISSGSLISAQVLRQVGPMKEALFIDWVDVEWGLRAKNLGFQNYVVPTAIMRHSIGDEYVRAGKKVINLHSTLRNYYIVRNATYLVRWAPFESAWRFTVALKIPAYIFFFAFHAKGQRLAAFKILVAAMGDGLAKRMGPAPKVLFEKR